MFPASLPVLPSRSPSGSARRYTGFCVPDRSAATVPHPSATVPGIKTVRLQYSKQVPVRHILPGM